jgi:hypothetical protein
MPDDASAMIDHSVAMSPAEATTALDAMTAALRGPVPLVPSNANEARQRLKALSSDSAWVKRYFEGDVKTRIEAESLNATIANSTLAEELAGGPVETSGGIHYRPRRETCRSNFGCGGFSESVGRRYGQYRGCDRRTTQS